MSAIALSLVILLVLFLGTFIRNFHLGLFALPAALLVALYAGLTLEDVTSSVPTNFLILILGVTMFFSVANETGTIDWILDRGVSLLRGRVALLPWVIFLFMGTVTALGTLPAAATAITAPIAYKFVSRYHIAPLSMAIMILAGFLAGAFSPISVYGLTLDSLYTKASIDTPLPVPIFLTLAGLAASLIFCVACFLVMRRGMKRFQKLGLTNTIVDDDVSTDPGLGGSVSVVTRTPVRTLPLVLTLTGFAVLIIGGVGFKLDLGYLAFTLAVVLQFSLRLNPVTVISRVPWSIVLLIVGILTYIAVLEKIGTFEWLNGVLSSSLPPVMVLLVVAYIAGITSFFANSVAVLVTVVPMLLPLIDSGISPVAGLIVVALASTIVDINPFGIAGGILLSSVHQDQRQLLFRHLFIFGLFNVALTPFLVWLVALPWL